MVYDELVGAAAERIRIGEYGTARALLREAVYLEVENPAAYNLLGALNERTGNCLKAMKFYRVAYYLDTGFQPARRNLHRLGTPGSRGAIDFGVTAGR